MPQAKVTGSSPTAPPPPELLSMQEVMKRLKIGRTTLYALIDEDPDFVTVKLGERRLMSVTALQEFIAAKEAEARGERVPARRR